MNIPGEGSRTLEPERNTQRSFFCSCDLDLDPMTFIYEPDPYPLKTYMCTESELAITTPVLRCTRSQVRTSNPGAAESVGQRWNWVHQALYSSISIRRYGR